MKRVLVSFLLIFIILFIPNLNIKAGRGCCSYHGGQSYCSNGRWVCKDGTYSPTCTCSGGSSSNGYKTTTRIITTTKLIYGCMNPEATNYNLNANKSDGSCTFLKTETKKEVINYETKVKGELKKGEKKIITNGQNGEKEIVTTILTDEIGNVISSEIISEKVIKEPINEVVKYDQKIIKEEQLSKNESSSSNSYILTLILLIIIYFYSKKNSDINLIINKIKNKNKFVRCVLYFLYFIFIIPSFIDILLILINLISNKFKEKKRI